MIYSAVTVLISTVIASIPASTNSQQFNSQDTEIQVNLGAESQPGDTGADFWIQQDDDDCVGIYLGKNLTVPNGETLDCNVVMVGGDIAVNGIINGDVVLLNTDLKTGPRGIISGETVTIGGSGLVRFIESEILERTIENAQEKIERESRLLFPPTININPGQGLKFSIGALGKFISLIITFITLLVLGLFGALLLSLGNKNINDLMRTIEYEKGKSLFMGLVMVLAVLPVFLGGTLALAVSIIGIPLIFFWILTVPLLFSLASFTGILLVSNWLGTKILTSENAPFRERFSGENLYHTVPVGLIGLQTPFLGATLISIAPMTGLLSGTLLILGGLIQGFVFLVGLGAIFLFVKRKSTG